MFLIIAAVILLGDLLSKRAVISAMQLGQSVPVVENVFHITYIRNSGAAFSMLADRTLFLTLVSVVVILVIIYLYTMQKVRGPALTAALGLVLGGSAGNLVDRLRFGGVVDFLDFRVFPVFNIADMAIVTGTGLLILVLLRSERNETPQADEGQN